MTFSPSQASELTIPSAVRALCEKYAERGHQAWLVGGCVRDLLWGRRVQDWDLATDARPEQTKKIFPRVIPTGLAHGTVTVQWQGSGYEVTTLRGEGEYSDGRRPDSIHFVDGIEEDLARRDFTVNAMAYDPVAQVLTDPFHGQADMAARTLRAVGDANQRFQEDGLRPLRGARFCATLDAQLAPDTEAAIRPNLDVFRRVSKERVREEWIKAFGARAPSRAIDVMASTGLLEVCCPGLAQETTRHLEIAGAALDHVRQHGAPPTHCLAALFHLWWDRAGETVVDGWLQAYRFSKVERSMVRCLLLHRPDPATICRSDVALRRWLRDVGRKHALEVYCFQQRLFESHAALGVREGQDSQAAAAELVACMATVEDVVGSSLPLTTAELALDGATLMRRLGISPGRRVGELLRALLDQVLEDPLRNNEDTLLGLAKELL